MNTVLWVFQAVLGAMFLMAGVMKLTRPYQELADKMGWPADFTPQTVHRIGAAETAGSVGLVLPWITGILPWLTPLAACGLATVMGLAARVHVRRKEPQYVRLTLSLLAGLAFVALGRFGVF